MYKIIPHTKTKLNWTQNKDDNILPKYPNKSYQINIKLYKINIIIHTCVSSSVPEN